MNDNRIIKDFENENGLNLEEIIKIYNNYIYTIIKNLVTKQEDIEEILSDTFIILWKNYNKLEKDVKVRPYLIGITKNLIKKKYRNYNCESIIINIDEMEREIVSNYDVIKLIEDNEKSKIISEIQDQMKIEEKQIFIMFYYQNKKIKEIAKILNISVAKVKVKLHRLRNLRKEDMTMENNELNNKVLKKVRNRIVVSNLEREERMRINKKKQIVSLTAVIMLVISGGFVTANANTNGQLVNNIKDTIKVNFVKNNGEKQELKGKSHTDSNGNTWMNYEIKTENSETEIKINKSEVEKQNMQIEENINEGTTDNSLDATVELKITEKE